jgi:hypothetical protein
MGQTGINSRGAESGVGGPSRLRELWDGGAVSRAPSFGQRLCSKSPKLLEPTMIKKILFVTVLSLCSSLAVYAATIIPAEASQSSGAGAGK